MRSQQEIRNMRDQLEDNIREHGWDPEVDAASRALAWALEVNPLDSGRMVRMYMERPEEDRRRDWIARGGDPAEWSYGQPDPNTEVQR